MASPSASALFETSVGLVVNKDRVEAGKLRLSDVMHELDYIKFQLNALARAHLLSSFTLFREGMAHLFKLKGSAGEVRKETEQAGVRMKEEQLEVFAGSSRDPMSNVSGSLTDLRLTNLDDADERVLSAAKKKFGEAHVRAIEAYTIETLPTSDRIQAMVIRVAATMLECIDHPEDAIELCILCLEDLHSLPEVKTSFCLEVSDKSFRPLNQFGKEGRRQIISSVCRINHAIRNAAVMIAKEGELFKFPLIDNGKEKINPLLDHRVADILHKLQMSHYSVTPLTLGKMDDKNQPKISQGIAANSQGQFIVGDEWDRSVKIFDSNGNFQYNLRGLPMDDENTMVSIGDVATDSEDSVYVLVELQQRLGATRFKICVFDKQGNMNHDFFLREETAEVLRVTVNNNNELLVLAGNSEKHSGNVVEVYGSDGHFKYSFAEEKLNYAQDICATSDGRVIILDRDDQRAMSVQVFRSNGEYIDDLFKSMEQAEKPVAKLRSSIACDQEGNYIFIAVPGEISRDKKADPVRILHYDMNDGSFIQSIPLHMEGLISTRGMALTVEGRIAVGLLDKSGGDSKVLVVG